ncbi:M28 family peptidase [Marinicellulosiphila megalodicopiae]|uniref:M28 family peptidase n=1 Tax=Marinicellulosiphila megalodicopiae TaxID=2724896 RepID=UPI003BB0FF21
MLKKIGKSALFFILMLVISALIIVIAVSRPTLVNSVEDQTELFVDKDILQKHVIYLSETAYPRNYINTDNLNIVADYIKNELSPYSEDISFQPYKVGERTYKNVIVKFGPDTDEIIIIGAHYDTHSDLPGADDNASGVAGLIELGRLLSTIELKRQVLLIGYTLEEPPFFNTEHMGSYVHAASIKNKTVKLMVSLEMIGYFSDEPNSQKFPIDLMGLIYPTVGNYIAVVDTLLANNAAGLKSSINKYTDLPAYSINAPSTIVGVDFSDHKNYWAFGYPAVMLTNTSFYRNTKYHTTQDTHDRLNYDLMAKVVYGLFKYVEKIGRESL